MVPRDSNRRPLRNTHRQAAPIRRRATRCLCDRLGYTSGLKGAPSVPCRHHLTTASSRRPSSRPSGASKRYSPRRRVQMGGPRDLSEITMPLDTGA